MNGRIQLIEQKLISIDSATLQNICDAYLCKVEKQTLSFGRTGTMLGKKKTTKGTPDTYYRTTNGDLVYVEYTTVVKDLAKKIINDINSCIDTKLTGISIEKVKKIIFFCNSKISVAIDDKIQTYAKSKNINVELVGLDKLAQEIYSNFHVIAKDFLGIEFDTGQILSIDDFIKEYNHKGNNLATPLDNFFLYRSDELTNIHESLSKNDILILSGYSGVGKTKIALKAVENFIKHNPSYTAYVVSNKDVDIFNDLRIYLEQKNDYVIVIDDANRQLPNLTQILGVFKETNRGNIKLLITARMYAMDEILSECLDFQRDQIIIGNFSDEEIKGIIKSDSFKIINPVYQNKIIELSDGNARIAVMAARLANEKQVEFLNGDVSNLYDHYFKTFIRDFDIFGKPQVLKVLGIISFFYTINKSDNQFLEELSVTFNISLTEFYEIVYELEKRELVETQYNHIKISEQVMATYFFYVVFMRDKILSFEKLLFSYFPNRKERFKDTVIPSHNISTYNKILPLINESLDKYINAYSTDDHKMHNFYSLFWVYKRLELVSYLHKKIFLLPDNSAKEFEVGIKIKTPSFENDEILYLLTLLLKFPTESFVPALELSFEYVKRKPSVFHELIKRITDSVLFEYDEEQNGFIRQNTLFGKIIEHHNKNEKHYSLAFFELIPYFLTHSSRKTYSARNNQFVLRTYQIPLNGDIKEFREKIWNELFNSYSNFPLEVISILKKFKGFEHVANQEIIDFDLSFILPFINAKLDPDIFINCFVVQELLMWLERKGFTGQIYTGLKYRFTNDEYTYFRKLDWNTFRGKFDYEFKTIDDFYQQKERDLREVFSYVDTSQFGELLTAIENTIAITNDNFYGLQKSLNIVVEENFIKDQEIGFKLLEAIIKKCLFKNNFFDRTFKVIIEYSNIYAEKLWKLLSMTEGVDISLKLCFFELLPDAFINEYYYKELFVVLQSIKTHCSLNFKNLIKFTVIDPNVLEDILKILMSKVKNEGLKLYLDHDFFTVLPKEYIKNSELLFEAYIEQRKLKQYEDFDGAGIANLVNMDVNLFSKYVNIYFDDSTMFYDEHDHRLTFVWNIDNFESILEDRINNIVDKTDFIGITEHPINVFFNNIKSNHENIVKQFIIRYIVKNNKDIKKTDAIFDVVRNIVKKNTNFINFQEDAFKSFLNENSSVEYFKQIRWVDNGGVIIGNDTTREEIEVENWKTLLLFTEKFDNQVAVIDIKIFIQSQIASAYNSIEREKMFQYIFPNH